MRARPRSDGRSFATIAPVRPVADLRYRDDMFVHGRYELPVTW
jgi:hypothetical protein